MTNEPHNRSDETWPAISTLRSESAEHRRRLNRHEEILDQLVVLPGKVDSLKDDVHGFREEARDRASSVAQRLEVSSQIRIQWWHLIVAGASLAAAATGGVVALVRALGGY